MASFVNIEYNEYIDYLSTVTVYRILEIPNKDVLFEDTLSPIIFSQASPF